MSVKSSLQLKLIVNVNVGFAQTHQCQVGELKVEPTTCTLCTILLGKTVKKKKNKQTQYIYMCHEAPMYQKGKIISNII